MQLAGLGVNVIDRWKREDASVIECGAAGREEGDVVGCCEDVSVANAVVGLDWESRHTRARMRASSGLRR